MSKNTHIKLLVLVPVLAFAAFLLAAPDYGVRAQNSNGNMDAPQENTGATWSREQDPDTGVRAPGEAEDLSGTWTGRARMSGGHEMDTPDSTLTITGNTFTLTAGGMTHNGRVIAITTRGYTGAAFIFDDLTDPVSNTKLACSVRVRKRANSIAITPVPGSRNKFWFNGRAS